MKPLLILAAFLLLAALSCKDAIVDTGPATTPFSLNIVVRDTTGAVMPGLRVAGGNLLSPRLIMGLNLDWWVNAVYVGRLTASDSGSGALLFRDSIRMVLADVDISNPPAILGYTGVDGKLTLTDRTRFPGTYSFPPIVETSGDGPDSIGEITILDTAMIVVYDTLSHGRMNARIVVGRGANTLNITWRPGPEALPSGAGRIPDLPAPLIAEFPRIASPQAITAIEFEVPTSGSNIDLSILGLDGTIQWTPFHGLLGAGIYQANFSTSPQGVSAIRRYGHSGVAKSALLSWKLFQNYPNPFD